MACAICGPTLGSNPKCPQHGTSEHAPDVPDDPSGEHDAGDAREAHAHYDAASPIDAIALHAEEHLCGDCLHADLCRHAPEESDLLIVVSRCRAFMHAE